MSCDISCLHQHTRRHFFEECGAGIGKIALASLMTGAFRPRTAAASIPGGNPMAPREAHFPSRVKSVIYLFMAGAPSQLDLFDYKPMLAKYEGQPIPAEIVKDQRYAFIRRDSSMLGPRYRFQKHGQSGAELSEMLPHLAEVAD